MLLDSNIPTVAKGNSGQFSETHNSNAMSGSRAHLHHGLQHAQVKPVTGVGLRESARQMVCISAGMHAVRLHTGEIT